MKKIILVSGGVVALVGCSKSVKLEEENKALKIDTMLQNKTIDRLFKETDSLERIIVLDSLKRVE